MGREKKSPPLGDAAFGYGHRVYKIFRPVDKTADQSRNRGWTYLVLGVDTTSPFFTRLDHLAAGWHYQAGVDPTVAHRDLQSCSLGGSLQYPEPVIYLGVPDAPPLSLEADVRLRYGRVCISPLVVTGYP